MGSLAKSRRPLCDTYPRPNITESTMSQRKYVKTFESFVGESTSQAATTTEDLGYADFSAALPKRDERLNDRASPVNPLPWSEFLVSNYKLLDEARSQEGVIRYYQANNCPNCFIVTVGDVVIEVFGYHGENAFKSFQDATNRDDYVRLQNEIADLLGGDAHVE